MKCQVKHTPCSAAHSNENTVSGLAPTPDTTLPPSNISHSPCSFEWNIGGNMTTIKGHESVGCDYVHKEFLMSGFISIGTFLFWQLKLQNFFPTVVRSDISYFAVVIAIFSMWI